MRNLLYRLWKEEDGQDLTEYALLVVLVALGSVAAMGSLSASDQQGFLFGVSQPDHVILARSLILGSKAGLLATGAA